MILQNPGLSPSAGAKANYYTQQKEYTAIHDGLRETIPLRSQRTALPTVAPPIRIFHPIFEQFTRDANAADLELPSEFIEEVQKLMDFASQLKPVEAGGNPEWRSKLSTILDIRLELITNADSTQPDGMHTIRLKKLEESIPLLILELKALLGAGSSDPTIQGGMSARRAWLQRDVSPLFKFLRYDNRI